MPYTLGKVMYSCMRIKTGQHCNRTNQNILHARGALLDVHPINADDL